ncbi:hypothetical protein L3Q82_018459, partial [Scortum barcoo]
GCCGSDTKTYAVGGWAWAWWLISDTQRITLEIMTLQPRCEDVETAEGVAITVTGVAQVKVMTEQDLLAVACEQFLGKSVMEIKAVVLQTLEGHLRSILGTLTVEQIYQDRDQFAKLVREVAAPDVGRMGIEILSFTIKDVYDKLDYLSSLGKTQTAAVQRDADIGVAEAERDAGIREAECKKEMMDVKFQADTKMADSKRELELQKAAFNQEVNTKKAEAQLATYELQAAKEQQKIRLEEIEIQVVQRKKEITIEEKEIDRTDKELIATVKRPAEAEAYKMQQLAEGHKMKTVLIAQAQAEKIRRVGEAEASSIAAVGKAEAEKMRLKAEAYQQYGEAAKTALVLEALPKIASKVAAPLAKTNEIVILSGEGGRVTGEVNRLLAELPVSVNALTGVDLSKYDKEEFLLLHRKSDMLACLPASGDPTIRLLSRSQMNTGLQKWETTQKMRSASYPTPAELDAYAKKVANNPLTIQIFPNSVKVPQRKHIRRTVNGLDTSLSSQRHSPYPSQVSSSRGLLAVLRAPAKGVVKESDGSRARQLQKAAMNPHSGPYAPQSTLNLQPQPAGQKQGMVHPQALQQSMTRPMALQPPHTMPHPHQALQQRSMAHQALQRQQSLSQAQTSQQQRGCPPPTVRPSQQQRLPPPHSQALQQSAPHSQALQQSVPHSQALQSQPCPPVTPQQHLSHLQTLKLQAAPPQALLTQQGATQDLRHMSDAAPLPSLQHPQGLVGSQPLPQAVGAGPPNMSNSLQQPPPGVYGPRKLPDADAPPNVTVSTSTIPLSMAASLHQSRPGDLSSIVHQINQMCQARAGMGSTSVCEGQIANPSPISRNLLINASSRVSAHHPALGSVPGCLMVAPPDKAAAQTPGAALHPQPNIAAANSVPAFHPDPEKVQLQQQQLQHHLHQQKQQQHLQLQQQQQRSWAQHQLAHMQQPPEGAHPCKTPRMEPPAECAFPSRNLSYSHKLPSAAQSFPLKHPAEKPPPSSPAFLSNTLNCPVGSMPYINGHYMQPPWGSIPAPAANNGPGPQDLPGAFQAGQAAASSDRVLGAKYRPGKEGLPGPPKVMHSVDFLGGDFQMPSFQEPNMDVMEKMHRSAMGQVQTPSNSGGGHNHHTGYR